MMLKEAKVTLDVFKGQQGEDGRIVKVRSVGYGHPILIVYGLYINGFAPDSHVLIPEADAKADYDYALYHRKPHVRGMKQVGVGNLILTSAADLI